MREEADLEGTFMPGWRCTKGAEVYECVGQDYMAKKRCAKASRDRPWISNPRFPYRHIRTPTNLPKANGPDALW
jgi:hypothetical protein